MSMPTGSPSEWYYVGHYGQLGPLTFDQIEELVRDGVIERDTFVWQSGMSNWERASAVPALAPVFASSSPYAAPPPPPAGGPIPEPPTTAAAPQYSASYPRPQYGYGAILPASDRNRILGGVLQLIIPGVGRLYLGYLAQGLLQLVLALVCLPIGWVWSLVDGLVILTGGVRIDGYGRALRD